MVKFELVVDDDPTTDREPWPSKRSFRAQHQPRCLSGHFIKKSNVKTIYPRSSFQETYIEIYCSVCERIYGNGHQDIR